MINVIQKLSDIKWWILHRIHPSHRYNIIKTGLAPGYYDLDMRITFGIFNLVCEFYIEEAPCTDWKESGIEWVNRDLSAVHIYWKVTRPQLIKEAEEPPYNDYYDKFLKIEEFDRQYLHKIIDMLPYLWS